MEGDDENMIRIKEIPVLVDIRGQCRLNLVDFLGSAGPFPVWVEFIVFLIWLVDQVTPLFCQGCVLRFIINP